MVKLIKRNLSKYFVMGNISLVNRLLQLLSEEVTYIIDKPEETPESTLKMLWFFVLGKPRPLKDLKLIDIETLPSLNDEQIKLLQELIEKRIDNVPLAYLVGLQDFLGIVFQVDERALIPRKETEMLGNKAIDILRGRNNGVSQKVIDVCCGCGNLGLAIKNKIPESDVYMSDITSEAVELAKENAKRLKYDGKVSVYQGDFLEKFNNDNFLKKVDLVVCNPPYIPSSKVLSMDVEISHNEPNEAFDGGMIGLKIIQRLISESFLYLKSDGWIAFEIGAGQGDLVMKFMERSKRYKKISTVRDRSNIIRVIYAQNNFV